MVLNKSPEFDAPELGTPNYRFKVDVFSLGILFSIMLFDGFYPFYVKIKAKGKKDFELKKWNVEV